MFVIDNLNNATPLSSQDAAHQEREWPAAGNLVWDDAGRERPCAAASPLG